MNDRAYASVNKPRMGAHAMHGASRATQPS